MKEEMIGKVVEVEDDSRYGYYYDVSNKDGDLTYLLKKYHGKTVKITIEVIN
ncbi:hypothetical protein AXJ14_gp167 [Geobacillus virus E3]|uniref:hypothetical protein n=1 Tax=Geobacillus virus E3 TaxID=1572712 RepID=UPI000671C071|nr:hypothetical protein AXJ14_gp167 [Geobacillus virus E3]AJA41486.1 hypothetical protein E3_0167 [Geobacillus virus E3]